MTGSGKRGTGWAGVLAAALLTAACSSGGSSGQAAGADVTGDSPAATGEPSGAVSGEPTGPASADVAGDGPSDGSPSGSAPASSGTGSGQGTGGGSGDAAGSGVSTSSGPAAAPPRCRTSQLDVSVEGGQGAAGSTYEQLVLTNTGHQPCTTGGFAGVSYVGSGDGTQIGAAARRVHRGQVHWFVLAPGERAQATLRAANAENYPPERCDPTRADGLRVYPPDQTAAAFVPQSTLACAKPGARLLSIGPFHQGH